MSADPTPQFGPMFPDWAGAAIVVPAVAATLSLEDPVTISSALQNVIIRARIAGNYGNGILFNIDGGTLADGGEIEEDVGLKTVTLKFNDGDFASDIFATINATSTLVEAIGFPNPGDQLWIGEDNFDRPGGPGPIFLEHGVEATTHLGGYWGPSAADGPASEVPPLITPAGPAAVATFALALQSLKITLAWETDVIKSQSALENRASVLDDPRLSFDGNALLLGDVAADVRAQLARFAAVGSPFALALPHEEATLTADASGFVFPVASTAILDWANVGQRVVVVQGASSIEGIIQDVGATSLTLDVGPGSVGIQGARIMPALAVFLDPQQAFQRRRTAAEYWPIKARAAVFGFPTPAQPAEAEIEGTINFEGVTLRSRTPGVSASLELVADSMSGTVAEIVADEDGNFSLVVHYADGGSTLEDVLAEFGTLFMLIGDFDPEAILTDSDEFDLTLEGTPAAEPEYGRGATITALDGRPIWDRGTVTSGTVGDSMQSMAEIVDMGGLPVSVGTAGRPDWGRMLAMKSRVGSEWQWLKAFLQTLRGRWKSFYVPTYRTDLTALGDAEASALTIDNTTGDFDLWHFDRDYDALRVRQADGVRYVRIIDVVDNGDGTTELLVDGDVLDAAPVISLSWLELCRLESDEVEVSFAGPNFTCEMNARVVQR